MIKELIKQIPANPGVYNYFNKQGKLIYVGKAKNLSKRVKSYFSKSHNARLQRMVSEIDNIKWIVTKNEKEALLLELNMIKSNRPQYNILMMDDKTYPYIHITNHKHPKIEVTRNIKKKKGKLFGPYPTGMSATEIVRILNTSYKLRNCKTIPNTDCLYLHIDQCYGPCVKNVDVTVYEKDIKEISNFLKGKDNKMVDKLKVKMKKASDIMDYESAKNYKDILEKISEIQERQKIISTKNESADYIAIHSEKGHIQFYILIVRDGKLMATYDKVFETVNTPEDALQEFVIGYYQAAELPNKLYLEIDAENNLLSETLEIEVSTPVRGNNKDLIKMAKTNAKGTFDKEVNLMLSNKERTYGAIEKLGKILNIKTPKHIEMFDNSHTAGQNYVSAMVAYINGLPVKNLWRKYNLESIKKNDDYAAMSEVIKRRYKDEKELPDIVFVDGGKGQISAAQKAAKELNIKLNIFGIVKDDKHNTRGIIDQDGKEYILDKSSVEFFMLERIQEDVHGFVIRHHRSKRRKSNIESVFDKIDGLGPKRQKALRSKFKTLNAMRQASVEELAKVVPHKIATNVKKTLTML